MIPAADLVGEVADNIEIDGNTAVNVARFKIYEHLNAAQTEIILAARVAFVDNALQEALFNLADGVNEIQFPSDYLRFVSLSLDFTTAITSSNRGREASEANQGEMQATAFAPIAKYPKFEIMEDGYRFKPVPSAAVTDGGLIRYLKNLPEITSSQACLLKLGLKPVMVFRATSLSAAVDNYRLDLAKLHKGYYDDGIKAFQ